MDVFFNLREDFMCNIHDFKCIVLSVTLQDVESIVQDVETNVDLISVTAFFY